MKVHRFLSSKMRELGRQTKLHECVGPFFLGGQWCLTQFLGPFPCKLAGNDSL